MNMKQLVVSSFNFDRINSLNAGQESTIVYDFTTQHEKETNFFLYYLFTFPLHRNLC